ncbi:MAG: extracellular solute-binding protein [Acetatifactor sp.]|nr:extracellular solute-binding protein [Acetatifactor sp.]
MRHIRKGLAVILTVLMACLSVVGCGNAPSGETGAIDSVKKVTTEDGKTIKTIKILGIDSSGTDDSGNTVYLSDWVNGDSKLWEKLTTDLEERGIRLELDLIPGDQYDTVIQTQIAAGLDCDFVNITSVDSSTRNSMIQQKKLLPINEIWDNYSNGNAKKYYTDGPGADCVKLSRQEDGNVYWLSAITVGDYKGSEWGSFTGAMIRQDWLNKLNLKMPQTTDELFDALKAFQEKDVNGNGEKDEVVNIGLDGFNNGIAQFFGLGTDICYIDYETGKVNSPWYQEGIKDYIQFMKELNDAGLLETSGQGDEKKAENKVSFMNNWMGETWEEAGIHVGEEEAAPYFVSLICQGVEGIDPLVVRQNGVQKGFYEYAVTSNADEEAIGILLDYLTTEEYSVLADYGIEDYTYRVNDEGKKAKITGSDISEVQIMSKIPALWVNDGILPRYEKNDRVQELATIVEAGKSLGYSETGYAEKAAVLQDIYEHPEQYHFAVMELETNLAAATNEEVARTVEIRTDLDTYYKELLTKLILGQADMDDWDTYISDMKSLGLDELISIIQARRDRLK